MGKIERLKQWRLKNRKEFAKEFEQAVINLELRKLENELTILSKRPQNRDPETGLPDVEILKKAELIMRKHELLAKDPIAITGLLDNERYKNFREDTLIAYGVRGQKKRKEIERPYRIYSFPVMNKVMVKKKYQYVFDACRLTKTKPVIEEEMIYLHLSDKCIGMIHGDLCYYGGHCKISEEKHSGYAYNRRIDCDNVMTCLYDCVRTPGLLEGDRIVRVVAFSK